MHHDQTGASLVKLTGTLMHETYPAARVVAPKVHAHFFRHLDAARQRGLSPVAALPDASVIERLIKTIKREGLAGITILYSRKAMRQLLMQVISSFYIALFGRTNRILSAVRQHGG